MQLSRVFSWLIIVSLLTINLHAQELTTVGKQPPVNNPLLTLADTINLKMQNLRGLKSKGTYLPNNFKRALTKKAELEVYLKQRFAEEYTDAELGYEADLLRRFGLLPEGIDYKKTMIDFLLGELGGYYDPMKQTLYLADWVPAELQAPFMAHEITHAIQDANFNLKPLLKRHQQSDEQMLAMHSLIEGDASLAMYLYAASSGEASSGDIPELLQSGLITGLTNISIDQFIAQNAAASGKAPKSNLRVIEQSAYFPYVEGTKFVIALYNAAANRQNNTPGNWSLVNQAFTDKFQPRSTAEILHPDLYLARLKKPQPAVTLDLKRAGEWLSKRQSQWQLNYENGFGEMGCRILVGATLPETSAVNACDGWLADRYGLFSSGKNKKDRFILWSSVWDNEENAKEYVAALKQHMDQVNVHNLILRRGRVALLLISDFDQQMQTTDYAALLPADYRTLYQINGI